jgi:hypothetical protein
MRDNETKREKERRLVLLQLINEAFSGEEVTELTPDLAEAMSESDPTWRVAIERPHKPRSPRVVLRPTEALMTDVGNGFMDVFRHAIQLARKVLRNPPLKDRNYQGTIYLDNRGATFILREN